MPYLVSCLILYFFNSNISGFTVTRYLNLSMKLYALRIVLIIHAQFIDYEESLMNCRHKLQYLTKSWTEIWWSAEESEVRNVLVFEATTPAVIKTWPCLRNRWDFQLRIAIICQRQKARAFGRTHRCFLSRSLTIDDKKKIKVTVPVAFSTEI